MFQSLDSALSRHEATVRHYRDSGVLVDCTAELIEKTVDSRGQWLQFSGTASMRDGLILSYEHDFLVTRGGGTIWIRDQEQ